MRLILLCPDCSIKAEQGVRNLIFSLRVYIYEDFRVMGKKSFVLKEELLRKRRIQIMRDYAFLRGGRDGRGKLVSGNGSKSVVC